ncbi:MAG: antibiotic biosynthesis monooxygenase family protein [Thermoanaerobaculales bacterium]|nr:antibiotic biosynthesis monooxygenase family protein [Thermoanaerobaculales bacterium]
MLTLRLRMQFAADSRDEATAVLRSLVGPVRAEQGCRGTELLRDGGDGFDLTWIEEWVGGEDFERHLRGPSFRRILAVIEMAAERPLVEIDDVASRRGFDLVEEILGVSASSSALMNRFEEEGCKECG